MHPKLMRNAPIAIAILVLLFTTPAAIAASLLSREKASAVCLIGEAAVFLWQDQADQKYRNASTDTAALAAQAYAAKRCKGGLNLLTEGGSDLVFHSIRAIAISLYGET